LSQTQIEDAIVASQQPEPPNWPITSPLTVAFQIELIAYDVW
jgi:hypothetical protein